MIVVYCDQRIYGPFVDRASAAGWLRSEHCVALFDLEAKQAWCSSGPEGGDISDHRVVDLRLIDPARGGCRVAPRGVTLAGGAVGAVPKWAQERWSVRRPGLAWRSNGEEQP